MRNSLDWQEPKAKPARCLSSKINLTIDLSPNRPGERTPFEEALRLMFNGGWTRKDARWFAQQAIKACSEAVLRDRHGAFPMEVVLVHQVRTERRGQLQSTASNLVPFRRNGSAS